MISIFRYDIEQGTDAWYAAKLGKPSASRASEILTSSGEISKSRSKYLDELITEAVTGRQKKNFMSWRMKEGKEYEQESREHFEMNHNIEVVQVGVVYYDDAMEFLSSPDGIMPHKNKGFETKDANPKIHETRLKKKKVDNDHWCQCQMNMLCTRYNAWWWKSYCPGMATLEIEIQRNEEYISKLHHELRIMHRQIQNEAIRLKSIKGGTFYAN